jgi:ribosomal protein L32
MKVQCPGCKSIYNIDISKIPAIPEGGITTTCPKCKGKIPVRLDAKSAGPKSGEEKESNVIIPCPQCGHVNVSSKVCVSCGKVFTKEELASLEISIGSD